MVSRIRPATRPSWYETAPVQDRWYEVIFVSQKLQVTRNHLVRTFRDKEGGGHLDDQFNRDGYLSMSRETWTSHMAGNQRSLCWGFKVKHAPSRMGVDQNSGKTAG